MPGFPLGSLGLTIAKLQDDRVRHEDNVEKELKSRDNYLGGPTGSTLRTLNFTKGKLQDDRVRYEENLDKQFDWQKNMLKSRNVFSKTKATTPRQNELFSLVARSVLDPPVRTTGALIGSACDIDGPLTTNLLTSERRASSQLEAPDSRVSSCQKTMSRTTISSDELVFVGDSIIEAAVHGSALEPGSRVGSSAETVASAGGRSSCILDTFIGDCIVNSTSDSCEDCSTPSAMDADFKGSRKLSASNFFNRAPDSTVATTALATTDSLSGSSRAAGAFCSGSPSSQGIGTVILP